MNIYNLYVYQVFFKHKSGNTSYMYCKTLNISNAPYTYDWYRSLMFNIYKDSMKLSNMASWTSSINDHNLLMYVYFSLKFHLIVIEYDKNSKYIKLIYSACILLEINPCACIKITVTFKRNN